MFKKKMCLQREPLLKFCFLFACCINWTVSICTHILFSVEVGQGDVISSSDHSSVSETPPDLVGFKIEVT